MYVFSGRFGNRDVSEEDLHGTNYQRLVCELSAALTCDLALKLQGPTPGIGDRCYKIRSGFFVAETILPVLNKFVCL